MALRVLLWTECLCLPKVHMLKPYEFREVVLKASQQVNDKTRIPMQTSRTPKSDHPC